MLLFRRLEDIPQNFGPVVLTIGNFDGLHRAHTEIIFTVVRRAKELGAKSIVLTFDPHPLRILRPDDAPKLITTLPIKLELLKKTGVDAVVMLPFSRDLSMVPAFQFAQRIIKRALQTVEVHEGFNFEFGRRAEADVYQLRDFGKQLGFDVVVHQPMVIRGHIVSSSKVRELIAEGNIKDARHVLGHRFEILSNPGRGRGYGTKYTVPTVNLAHFDELLPKNGVYITQSVIDNETFDCVTNIGNRPTFGPDSFAIESHILNFHPIELTTETPVRLSFLKRLRNEIRFPDVESLKTQIGKDVKKAQRYFELMRYFKK